MKDLDLNNEETIRHIFPATKLIADTFSRIIPELPETLHYIYDLDWFPQNFINIPVIASETIQKLFINHHKIEIKNCAAKSQPFTCLNVPENTITSLEASPIEHMDTIIHFQQTDTRITESRETNFNTFFITYG